MGGGRSLRAAAGVPDAGAEADPVRREDAHAPPPIHRGSEAVREGGGGGDPGGGEGEE
jgi:hypothetical protein